MKPLSFQQPERLVDLAEIHLSLKKYDEVIRLMIDAFKNFENENTKPEDDRTLTGLMVSSHLLNKPVMIGLLANNKTIREIVISHTVTMNHLISPFEYVIELYGNNAIIIEFLVKTGYYKEALEIVLKSEKAKISGNYRDTYYYHLGLVLEKSNDFLALEMMAKKIKTDSLSVDLMLRLASYYLKTNQLSRFIGIMNIATQRVSKGRTDAYVFGQAGDVTMAWLAGGFYKEAFDMIHFESTDWGKEMLLFEIGQRYVSQYQIDQAMAILTQITDIDYQALLWSKIASRLFKSGKKEIALDYFKKAIEMVIKSNKGYLNMVLEDYTSAVKLGLFIETHLWENRMTVD